MYCNYTNIFFLLQYLSVAEIMAHSRHLRVEFNTIIHTLFNINVWYSTNMITVYSYHFKGFSVLKVYVYKFLFAEYFWSHCRPSCCLVCSRNVHVRFSTNLLHTFIHFIFRWYCHLRSPSFLHWTQFCWLMDVCDTN